MRRSSGGILVLLVLTGLWAGCSAERYRESADREVKSILAVKTKSVTGKEEPFALERKVIALSDLGTSGEVEDLKRTPPPKVTMDTAEKADGTAGGKAADKAADTTLQAPMPGSALSGSTPAPASPPKAPQTPEDPAQPSASGTAPAKPPAAASTRNQPVGAPKVPAKILGLDDVMRAAFTNNREYQDQKESVYLNALTLTLVRWQFAPRFFGLISGDYVRDGQGNSTGSISSDFGWNQVFASGARLALSVTNNFSMFFFGNKKDVANTIISGTFTQPLLRGFGSKVIQEPLIQAERQVIYQIRSFERFRQTFLVQISSQFYRVLAARNRVSNEYLNWQGLVNNLDQARAMAEGERMPKLEVDQVLQQELSARNRYVVAVEDYLSALDRLKVTLNLPVDAIIGLDEDELGKLEGLAVKPFQVAMEDAIATALDRRLDYMNSRDQADDAVRKVEVAANALRAQLDLKLTGSLPSNSDNRRPLKFDVQDATYGAGFDLNLPFDRRAERNSYTSALINVEAEKRAASLFEDNVRIAVRDAYRQLLRERETYQIQEASVRLAEARVDSTNTLRDAGRAITRDVLESQQALIEARNSLTSALINLAIARLQFSSDTGILLVRENGRYEEDAILDQRAREAAKMKAAAAAAPADPGSTGKPLSRAESPTEARKENEAKNG